MGGILFPSYQIHVRIHGRIDGKAHIAIVIRIPVVV